jgi:hypothetical protein
MSKVNDVSLISLPRHVRDDGELVVAEYGKNVGFPIVRLFTIKAPADAERGKHAHRHCSQFMLCLHGAVDVVCDDGVATRTVTLDSGDRALLVPPMIWNTVVFRQNDSVLAVLCDRQYEAEDYVHDYQAFLAMRREMTS